MKERGIHWELFKVFVCEKSLIKFMLGVVFSFSFSMAVILGTIGLMDGFDYSMKKAMKRSTGDLLVHSQDGFFPLDRNLQKKIKNLKVKEMAGWIKTEGFIIAGENAKGVVIRGIEPVSFFKTTDLNMSVKNGEIVIGDELANHLDLKEGDSVVLAFASGNEAVSSMSLLRNFKLTKIIHHGLYREDMRFVYLNLYELQQILGVEKKVNILSLNIPPEEGVSIDSHSKKFFKNVEEFATQLLSEIGAEFKVTPFWQQFTTLFEAVKVQKFMIGLILQLIVITSIFNMMAFVIFIHNQKSREIFLLGALGLSQKGMKNLWWGILRVLWLSSCGVAILMVQGFDFALNQLAILKMPGEIYYMSRFSLKIGMVEYLLVFLLAFFWLKVIYWFSFYKLRKKSVLSGLKKEFI